MITHAAACAVACLAAILLAAPSAPGSAGAGEGPISTRVVRTDDGFELRRGGEPYQIRGIGGAHRLALLAEIGGNSFRTWGAQQLDETRVGPDGVERKLLDHAHHLGLSVCVGFWMEHERHGYDYRDETFRREQLDKLAGFVRRFKDHPAVLAWGIGNETEIGAEDPERVFRAIEEAAALVKSIDPDHPTMTVVAEIGGGKAAMVERLCPSIDILGINSYGGLPSLRERLEAQGVDTPYVIAEFGPLGHWETGSTPWGAPYEQTSTEKAAFLREGYVNSILDQPDCLGGYAFLWGHKQERTATWYGMFLDTGEKTESIDVLHELWTGEPHDNLAPTIGHIRLHADGRTFAPGQSLRASVEAADPDGDPLRYVWVVREESTDLRTGGDREAAPPDVPGLIRSDPGPEIRFDAPGDPGAYRLFVYVYDDHDAAATANVPFLVE